MCTFAWQSDFYATDAGRAHFADQLKSIRYCVQEVGTASDAVQPTQPMHQTPT